jgi:bacterioferritin (cytochrome b1)
VVGATLTSCVIEDLATRIVVFQYLSKKLIPYTAKSVDIVSRNAFQETLNFKKEKKGK